ncbi:hypothetical protein DY052_07670 [Apilactobacillus timberlakei]|uniref:toprim domain-containing protein n=1 Tax=Apilactobacillus timberlakei TaxID=2008380 RepID=UPI0011288D0D|nr:toprim domain-containing protein [Apilactobacillus timberlakei]TPR13732.1 hypothetical protein DY052_07670 [Apilactobacillus timberlakei]
MADNESNQDTGKNLEEFYRTLERGKRVYDKFYNEHNSTFIQDTSDIKNDSDYIENVGNQYEKDPFVDNTRRFAQHTSPEGRKLAVDYLVGERKLSPNIVNTMIDQDLIRAENNDKYHYIEFAWKKPNSERESNKFTNMDQQVVGADRMNFEKNSQGKMVRRSRENGGQTIAKNSESGYGFNVKTGTGKDNLFIFEAPVDALSYATLNGAKLAHTNSTLLSLGGVSKTDSIQSFIHKQYGQHKDFKNIVISVDKDHAGRKMIGDFTKSIQDKEYFVNHPDQYRHHVYVKQANVGKDWNDTVKATNRFINQTNDDDATLERSLSRKTRYDIDDYILQRTKRMINGNDMEHNIANHVQALNSMYDKFEQNHDVNFYSKAYGVYKTTSKNLSDSFKEYMDEFGKNMQPKELNKYIQKSLNNIEITPNERANIRTANRLKNNNKIGVLNDFVANEALNNNPSLKALDDYQAIMKKVQKNSKLNKKQDIERPKNQRLKPDNHKIKHNNDNNKLDQLDNFDVSDKMKQFLQGDKHINDDKHVNKDFEHKLHKSSQNDTNTNKAISKAMQYENKIDLSNLSAGDLKGKTQQSNNKETVDQEKQQKGLAPKKAQIRKHRQRL